MELSYMTTHPITHQRTELAEVELIWNTHGTRILRGESGIMKMGRK